MAALSEDAPAPLEIRGLRKSFNGVDAVAGIDFALARGECFALLGPNGAGKTTTLKLLLGLSVPDAGDIRLCGRAIPVEARQARRHVGVVPQNDNLDPDFTVTENLLVFGRYFGMSAAAVRSRIPELLEFAGLAGRASEKISALSGGMKRRLALARALVGDPELLVLDEPTTGLDPQARHLIWERLKQLVALGKTVLLTTHFMDEAERLANRIAIMDGGRIVVQGPPREVIARNIEPQVVEVYGDDVAGWAQREAARHASRFEISGETAFCYADDPRALLESLQHQPALRYLHRPANLEDVFLKLTGRELRD
ncbi:MAG: ATP-binding cassette domain-containing protein [Sterolibacteriaceae bacterium]|nr:ATP-binding cassette domain-containing protein [Sterolibacteriaceae bacterium]